MYQQNNHSLDSVVRRSSHNPFRQSSDSLTNTLPMPDIKVSEYQASSSSAFDEWVDRNRRLLSNFSDDEDSQQIFERPPFPSQSRIGSDTNVNYRRMSSNNPFASAMTRGYQHHRDPPPPPSRPSSRNVSPQKSTGTKKKVAPPSYDEVTSSKASSRATPKEKEPHKSSSFSRSSRPHRSQSGSTKHREKRSHHKSSKDSKKKAVAPHQSKNLDVIDKLDVSAFYGGRFHHDGPFDACAPHRNKNVKAAPVMAFPANGPNNSMKASADTKSSFDIAFGNVEDHNMIVGRSAKEPYNSSLAGQPKSLGDSLDIPRFNPSVVAFDVNEKSAPIHGLSTAGLGSTTFLNGAPAPKFDEHLSPPPSKGGLNRKKSLVQRLRKNSGSEESSRRNSNDSSDDYRRSSFADEDGSSSLLQRVKSLKVGRK